MKTERHLLALPEGYRLGKYVVEGVLGSGGFGITYLAEDTSLGRRVAIKELLPGDFATRVGEATVAPKGRDTDSENLEWARSRFIEEGQVLAACTHSNVVEVYEAFAANGTAYLVTRYEEGQDLERWLRGLGRPPTDAELRAILWPLLSGLERVHQAGFLHRDVKPENIYLTTGGRPVLLDFGSARQAIGSRSRVLTAVVTAGYAPFEQYHEGGQQGPWTDIYALGAVMYRAITGQKPPEAAARMMGNDPYKSLASSQAGRYSAALLKGLDRALRVKASERPQNIAQWRALLGEGPTGETAKLLGPKRPRSWVWWLGGAALAVLALAGLALWFIIPHRNSEPTSSPTPGATASAPPDFAFTPVQASTPTGTSQPNSPLTLLVPGEYATIQAAIDAARPGDTVRINAGTYNEALNFKAGITLEGDNADATIVRFLSAATGVAGQAHYAAPLEVRDCGSGTIRNLTFRQEQSDPRGNSGNAFKIDAVMIFSSTVTIEGCRVTSLASCGIGVYGSDSAPQLLNNQCGSNAWHGILFNSGSKGIARGNVCDGNSQSGIVVFGEGTAPELENNECRSNKLSGLSFGSSSKGTAQGNICEGNSQSGIGVFDAGTNPWLRNNQCRSNTLDGIYFGDGALGSAEDNVCEKNGEAGIVVSKAGTNPELKGNECRSNAWHGILFNFGSKGTAQGNICEDNTQSGIAVFHAGTNPDLKGNQCRSNRFEGIYFGDGALGSAEDNVCEKNAEAGILVSKADTNPELKGNQCRANKLSGILFNFGSKGVAEGNICEANAENGIGVFHAGTNPELRENKCNLNKFNGICFAHGARGRATQNVCSFNLIGIAINSASPVLDGNFLRSNKQYGLGYDESSKPVLAGPQIYDGNKDGEVNRHIKFQ